MPPGLVSLEYGRWKRVSGTDLAAASLFGKETEAETVRSCGTPWFKAWNLRLGDDTRPLTFRGLLWNLQNGRSLGSEFEEGRTKFNDKIGWHLNSDLGIVET